MSVQGHVGNVHVPESGSVDYKRQPLVHYGTDVRRELARLAQEHGWRRVLPVVTPSLASSAHVLAALEALGDARLPAFTELKEHTPFEIVLALCARIREAGPDAIVAIGGGSAIDAVKIAALGASAGVRNHDDLLALRGVSDAAGNQTSSPGSRTGTVVVAVPTTLSGAEFGLIAGATETASATKHLFRGDTLAPNIVLYDPSLALATPMQLWLSTGIRAVDHAVESVLSRDANPFTDALALRALALLKEGLEATAGDPGDLAARHRAQLGTWLASSGIGRVRYGASHGIGHQLGAVAGVPHGITSCVLLPAVVAYNAPLSGPGQADIARALGMPDAPAADSVRALIARLGLPTRIAELNVPREALPKIASTSLGNAFVKANLRPIEGEKDVLAILAAAF
jgi:alcohol dehydrogenase class IV